MRRLGIMLLGVIVLSSCATVGAANDYANFTDVDPVPGEHEEYIQIESPHAENSSVNITEDTTLEWSATIESNTNETRTVYVRRDMMTVFSESENVILIIDGEPINYDETVSLEKDWVVFNIDGEQESVTFKPASGSAGDIGIFEWAKLFFLGRPLTVLITGGGLLLLLGASVSYFIGSREPAWINH